MNNWLHLSESALAHNFKTLQAAVGPATEILAVIKANAYGHGAEACAPLLIQAGARWLGVTCASEGVRVRQALGGALNGAAADLLVMCGLLAEDVPLVQSHALTPVVWTPEQVGWLDGTGARVHVEIDTGMGRQGVAPGAALAELLTQIAAAGLRLDGVFTHFCSSEEAGSALTLRQQELFAGAIGQVRAAGLKPAWVHAGNSSTVDNPPDNCAGPEPWLVRLAASVGARAMVRTGLALYGYCLPIDGLDESTASSSEATRCRTEPLELAAHGSGPVQAVSHVAAALQPVLTWRAHVLSVRDLAAGETVGYNATFIAPCAMRIALLPVGYADGLRRELSSTSSQPGGWVMLDARRAPILGRISMNLTVVDVSGIPGVRAGDEAVLLGPGISADDHARLAGTIAYEILCGLHPCG